MAVTIEEFVAHLGWEVDSSQLDEFNGQVKDTISFFGKVAAAIAGATAALTAFTVATNKQTSIQTQLAEAYDISAESAENWGFLLGAIGLEADNVIRAAKDLNVRLGQAFAGIGSATIMKDAVRSLGLEFNALEKMKPEEQFKTILQAAKDLDNQQVALAASQQLLGRQGVMITGFLRDQQGTIEELLTEQAKFNFLTEENREQAKAFIALWDNTTAVIDSAKASFAAYLGEALSPLLKEFLEWVKVNRELIKLKIAEWAERVGRFLDVVFRTLRWGLMTLDKVIDAFGGLENVLAILAGTLAGLGVVKIIGLFTTLVPLILNATKAVKALNLASVALAGKWILVAGVVALAGLAINSLVRFFQGKDSLVGDLGEILGEKLDIWVKDLSEFFGFSKEEFDRWLVITVDNISDAFDAAWKAVSGFFTRLSSMSWGDILDVWMFIWGNFVDWLTGVWDRFVNWLSVTVPGKIAAAFRDMANTAISWIKKIPLVESLVGNVNVSGGQSLGSATQQPSAGVQQTINQTRAIQNTVSNISRNRGPVTVNMNNSITQRPGESGEALARRIRSGVRQEFAAAIRDNDTGVDY